MKLIGEHTRINRLNTSPSCSHNTDTHHGAFRSVSSPNMSRSAHPIVWPMLRDKRDDTDHAGARAGGWMPPEVRALASPAAAASPRHTTICARFRAGAAPGGTVIPGAIRPTASDNPGDAAPLLIGVAGEWYDVSRFVHAHPGGDVLLEFVGQDATAQFLAFHDPKELNRVPRRGSGYAWDRTAPNGDPLDGEWLRLHGEFTDQGLFETDFCWVARQFVLVTMLLVGAVAGAACSSSSFVALVFGAVCLGGFWQQCGFLMHDFMHCQVFHSQRVDQHLGWLFGTVGFGVSGRWWRDEHHEHHLFVNTVEPGVGAADPSAPEDVWCQSPRMFEFWKRPWLLAAVLKVQHVLFVPILIFAGPIALKMASVTTERRPVELAGLALHVVWVGCLLSLLPTPATAFLFLFLSSMAVGVLEIQLLVSHYANDFVSKEDSKSGGWMRRQLGALTDIETDPTMDWFHGGLNMHSPHHLFPRMPRHHFRRAQAEIRAACAKHGVVVDSKPLGAAVVAVIQHLAKMDELFDLDPRG